MAGTVEGGRKSAITNKQKHGADFYVKNGAKGGRLGRTGGFYANRDLARKAGALGGAKSRRGKLKCICINPLDHYRKDCPVHKNLPDPNGPSLGEQFGKK